MTVTAELWPLAADEHGIWLLTGSDAVRSRPVPQDGDVHCEIENLLVSSVALPQDAQVIHSTSWRPDGPSIVLTYVAVIGLPEQPQLDTRSTVLDEWPNALPVSLTLANHVGAPPTHGATQPPVPRYVDVLYHAVRHLRFLVTEDATVRDSLSADWKRHLALLEPSLSGMYAQAHQ